MAFVTIRIKGAEGYTYTRYANPTVTIFEERMALLEGSPVGRATASGMAAGVASPGSSGGGSGGGGGGASSGGGGGGGW